MWITLEFGASPPSLTWWQNKLKHGKLVWLAWAVSFKESPLQSTPNESHRGRANHQKQQLQNSHLVHLHSRFREMQHFWQICYFIKFRKFDKRSVLSTTYLVLSTLIYLETCVCFQTDYLKLLLTFLCNTWGFFHCHFPWVLSTWFTSSLKLTIQNFNSVFTNFQYNHTTTLYNEVAHRLHLFIYFRCLPFMRHHCFGKTVACWLEFS